MTRYTAGTMMIHCTAKKTTILYMEIKETILYTAVAVTTKFMEA